jgi:hypothetical protein
MADSFFSTAGRRLRGLFTTLKSVHAAGNGNPFGTLHQAARITHARLRYGITPVDYLYVGMVDWSPSDWSDYISKEDTHRIVASLNDPGTREIAYDKVRFYDHCLKHALPTVPVLGIVVSEPPPVLNHLQIASAEALIALLSRHPGPSFFKLVRSSYGRGAFKLEQLDDGFRFAGRRATAEEVLDHCLTRSRDFRGYLIQPCIEMHESLKAIMSPSGVGTMRVVSSFTGDSPRFFDGCLRLTVGENIIDNFVNGTSGNLAAAIDRETGALLSSFGPHPSPWRLISEVPVHPDTGRRIAGFTLPDWQEAKALVLRAHASLPQLKLLAWDVAFTRTGPMLVEVNATFNIELLQVAFQRGFRRQLREALGDIAPAADR